jgi:hypothetical protein
MEIRFAHHGARKYNHLAIHFGNLIQNAKNHEPKPATAEEFVNYYQTYVAEFNAAREGRLTAGADKKAVTQKLVEDWGAPNNPKQVGQAGLKAVGDDMKGIESYWSSHISENSLPLPTGVSVRDVPPQQIVEAVTKMAQDGKITFGNQSTASYHTAKHFSNIPDSHIVKGSDGNPLKAQPYHQSALTTIKTSGVRDAPSIAAGAQEGQYGGGRTFYFKDGEITAFVLVTDNRQVILATYYKKEQELRYWLARFQAGPQSGCWLVQFATGNLHGGGSRIKLKQAGQQKAPATPISLYPDEL